jgi:hypothetical protein
MELISVPCPDMDGVGTRCIYWLNARTGSKTVFGDVQVVWLIGDKLSFNGHISDFVRRTKNVDEYEIRRAFVGTGWIFEFVYHYKRLVDDSNYREDDSFTCVSFDTNAHFDDEMLALEFKLSAPWEVR